MESVATGGMVGGGCCRSEVWGRVRRWGGVLTLAAILVASGGNARAEDNADQNIYVDGIVGSWDDWSFNADRNWNSTEHVRSFGAAGKVSFTQAWGAVRWHYRGFDTRAFDTTGFTHLEMNIHWGGVAPQAMLVYVLRNEDFNKTTKLTLSKYDSPDPALDRVGWQRFLVPLADLKVAGVADVTDIILSGPTPKVPFWIDDVKLVKAPSPERAAVTVDAGKVVRTLDGRHLGINAAAWDPLLADARTVARVKAAGLRFFRYPGGSWADQYRWETNKVGNATQPIDTLKFMTLVKEVGGQAMITVNYGTGTPREAARWVRFANVTNRLGVKYWEVGNENYLDSEPGSHDPVEYARRFSEYYAAMKREDPTIKIGMPGLPSRKESNGWAVKALSAIAVRPDFYVLHYYPQVRWSGTPHENDANLLQTPRDWGTMAQIARSMLTEYLGPESADVEILATENNSVAGQPGKQSVSIVNALYLADSVGQLLNTEINAFMWWDLHNSHEAKNNNSPTLFGHRPFGDYGILSTTGNPFMGPNTPYPTYYALQLVSQFAGEGSRLVSVASDHELLPVYGALRSDDSLALLVVNKHSQKALSSTFDLAGFAPAKAKVQQYAVFEDLLGLGVSSFDAPVNTPRFDLTFPPYSLTLLELGK